jgi:hypothetical protein
VVDIRGWPSGVAMLLLLGPGLVGVLLLLGPELVGVLRLILKFDVIDLDCVLSNSDGVVTVSESLNDDVPSRCPRRLTSR